MTAFNRAGTEGFISLSFLLSWSERIKHTPFGQGVYFFIASRILYPDYFVHPYSPACPAVPCEIYDSEEQCSIHRGSSFDGTGVKSFVIYFPGSKNQCGYSSPPMRVINYPCI